MQAFAFEDFTVAPPVAGPAAGALAPSADEILDMVAQARAEADAIREAAYAEGLEAGRRDALAAAAGGVEAFAAAAADARRAGAERAERLERDAVELALSLAERIVGGAIAVQPELVLEAVRTALRSVVERERVTVLVNPADLPLVSEAVGGLQRELGGIEHLDVQAERRVGAGGAIVRHAAGEVDARVETKLERARELVESVLGEAA